MASPQSCHAELVSITSSALQTVDTFFPSQIRLYRLQITAIYFIFCQHVSIASCASAGIAREEMSVCPSVTLLYCIKTEKAGIVISSPSESPNVLVSGNTWFITKFDRGDPERGRFLRLGWVRTGKFGDFSTNKPPHLWNGAR